MPGNQKKSVLLNTFFTTLHSFLVVKHQITYKQRKWVAMFPQIVLKTLSINFQSLSCFTLLIHHFTRKRYREKPLRCLEAQGKKSALALSIQFLLLCKHEKIVLAMRKRTEDIRQIIWKVLRGVYLILTFSSGWQPIFSCMYSSMDIKNPYKISYATPLYWLWI